MKRIRILAKGNVDIHDSLVFSRVDGQLVWNGINELTKHTGIRARVRHQTMSRSDILLQGTRDIPPELFSIENGPYTFSSQLQSTFFEEAAKSDIVALSIQADLMNAGQRHNDSGTVFYANPPSFASEAHTQRFTPISFLAADEAAKHWAEVVLRIRKDSDALIVMFNVSTWIPGENAYSLFGTDETLFERMIKFNLALYELSRTYDVALVDVDRVIAGAGAAEHKIDFIHYTANGHKRIAQEFWRVIEHEGALDAF